MNRTPSSFRTQNLQRRPRATRYSWLRLFNNFPDHPKWELVATEARSTRGVVIATVTKLLTVANKGHSRGSIEDFSSQEWALTLGVPHDEVVRIFDALYKVGWIDQAFLVTWYEHQPEEEDPTRYERVKRYRQKKREEKQAEHLARLRSLNPAAEMPTGVATAGLLETAFQSGETAFHHKHVGGVGPYAGPGNVVSAVIETPRSEPEKERGLSKEGKVEQQIPRTNDLVWLYGRGGEGGRGLFLVMHGCQRGSELYARNLIAGWLRELSGCADRLNGIIEAVSGQATGAAYEELMTQHVANARDLASGSPRLPLPPLPLVKTAGE